MILSQEIDIKLVKIIPKPIYIDGDTCQWYCNVIGGSSGHVIQTNQLYYELCLLKIKNY